ncbi:sensor histidine kinase [Nonomuraea pusilla]|uniref:sensor histidine kinase n=1 Tax=Nonomuraea pusilla TaxID=46177 RepID=UPI00332A1304
MPDESPRPPLWQRLPPVARALLTWCGLATLVPLLYAVTLDDAESLLPVGPAHAAFAAAMAVPLAWARRRPDVVLLTLLAETATAGALGLPAPWYWPLVPAADVLAAVVTATRSRRAGLLTAGATLAVQETVWHAYLLHGGLLPSAPGFLALSALLALAVLVAWTSGTLVRQRRAYDEALRGHAAAQAITAERLRIARDLHDMVAHSIGIIAIQAGAGARVISSRPEQAREALDAIESTSRQTLKGLRRMLGALRDPVPSYTSANPRPSSAPADPPTTQNTPPDPSAAPGLADVERLAEMTAAAGLHVDVRRLGRPRPLPAAVDRSAFRIVQESVTNVLRHARTRHCQVTIAYGGDDLSIEISDDGPSPGADAVEPGSPTSPPDGGGHGITGMRERAALLDGHLTAGPRPGGGFQVTARLPLTALAGRPAAANEPVPATSTGTP